MGSIIKGAFIRAILAIVVAASLAAGCATRQEAPKQYADYSKSSGFTVSRGDSVTVENLEVLARVWGLVKYHHPVFAATKLNADYELFELLPKVARVSQDECNAVLLGWLNGLGEFKSAEEKYRRKIADKEYISPVDWNWLGDKELLGAELSQKLQELRWAERPKPSRYAYFDSSVGKVDFKTESAKGSLFPDAGYNLLTLFRLWNMAEYYFPSVGITNKKWDEVLPEYINRYLYEAEGVELTNAGLIAELSDSHSRMTPNPVYPAGNIPAELSFVENKLIVTDSWGSEFKPGDEIVSIGGKTPEYFLERARKYVAASNENALLRRAAEIAGTADSGDTQVVFKRNGRRMELSIATLGMKDYYTKMSEREEAKTYYKLLSAKVGYLYPGLFKNADGAAIMEQFKGTKAIIIDMRCYPADFMPFEFVGRYFVPNEVQHVTFTKPVAGLPGFYEKLPTSLGGKNENYYKGRVIVLVNEHTQSQAEYTTMAFQSAPDCIVVGSQTSGADGDVVLLSLPGGATTYFSGLGVLYPDGTNTQRTGVKIDHYVTPTIAGVKAGRDEVLEYALKIIESVN